MGDEVRIFCLIPWSDNMSKEYVDIFLESFETAKENTEYKVIPIWGIQYEEKRKIPSIIKNGTHFHIKGEMPGRMSHFRSAYQHINFNNPTYNDWIVFLDVDDRISPNYFSDAKLEDPDYKLLLTTAIKVDRETNIMTIPAYLQNQPVKGEIEAGKWGLTVWGKFYRFSVIQEIFLNRGVEIDIACMRSGCWGSEYKLISILYSYFYKLFLKWPRAFSPEVGKMWDSIYYWYRNPVSLTNKVTMPRALSAIAETDDFLKEAVACSFGSLLLSQCKPEEMKSTVINYSNKVLQIWPEGKDCGFYHETLGRSYGYSKKSYVAQALMGDGKYLPEGDNPALEWIEEGEISDLHWVEEGGKDWKG